MSIDWDVASYKARLDAALKDERWQEVDRIRIAAKKRLLEAVAHDRADEVELARGSLWDSLERFRLGARIAVRRTPETMAAKLSADAETAGLAAEVRPRFDAPPRDAEEAVLRLLSSGNRRPMSTTELAEDTGYRLETVARMLTRLRTQGKIVSRRSGRHMLHSSVEAKQNNSAAILSDLDNKWQDVIPSGRQPSRIEGSPAFTDAEFHEWYDLKFPVLDAVSRKSNTYHQSLESLITVMPKSASKDVSLADMATDGKAPLLTDFEMMSDIRGVGVVDSKYKNILTVNISNSGK